MCWSTRRGCAGGDIHCWRTMSSSARSWRFVQNCPRCMPSAMAYASRRPVEFGLLAIAETIQRWLVRVRLHLVATAVVTSSAPDDQQYRHASSVEQLMPLRIGLRQRHDSLDAILHRDTFHGRHDGRTVVAGDDLD